MSFVKIWVHAVWSTKDRKPVLNKDVRQEIFEHIHHNAIEKDIYMEIVNGHQNHVHCLFRLKADQTIQKTLQLIKGEASFWANKHGLVKPKLAWQNDYFAVSVSESQVGAVKKYIENQEEHHAKKTFEQECNEFFNRYGFRK